MCGKPFSVWGSHNTDYIIPIRFGIGGTNKGLVETDKVHK